MTAIRLGRPGDAAGLLRITNHDVASSDATFDEQPRSIDEQQR